MQAKKNLVRETGKALKKASPTILTCIGAIGVVGTAILAAKAAPKALEQVKAAKTLKMEEKGENLTRLETIAACWMTYTPSALAGMATIGCIFGANTLNHRQQASLLSAYAFLDRSFREYKNAVKAVYGEEGHKRVLESLSVAQTSPPRIYDCWTGEAFDFGVIDDQKRLFFDDLSQRYFDSTIADVLLAEFHTNRDFAIHGGEISVDRWYKYLGLETPEELKDLGWYVSDYYCWVDFDHSKTMIDDGEGQEPLECWVIEMPFPPTLEPIED